MEKMCKVCSVMKSYTDFYKQPRATDQHSNKCKECQKRISISYRNAKIEQYREYDRQRSQNPDRVAARAEYAKTQKGKLAKGKAVVAYNERNPLRKAAHRMVGNYLRNGRLSRPNTCESCGSASKIEGHHDDYTKPLEVRWLCEICHKDWHRHYKPIYGLESVGRH